MLGNSLKLNIALFETVWGTDFTAVWIAVWLTWLTWLIPPTLGWFGAPSK